jgi:hypothetical protein
MATSKKNFASPDIVRTPSLTRVETVELGGEDHVSARLALVRMHQAGRRHRDLSSTPRWNGHLGEHGSSCE